MFVYVCVYVMCFCIVRVCMYVLCMHVITPTVNN